MNACAPYFDSEIGAWIISRYADVSAALRDTNLVLPGAPPRDALDELSVRAPVDLKTDTSNAARNAHTVVRSAAAHSLSPARLDAYRADWTAEAQRLAAQLPLDTPVDVQHAFARPWSLYLAMQITGVAATDIDACAELARTVFEHAARSRGGPAHNTATDAAVALSTRLSASAFAGRHAHGDNASADVQTFVALAETLPCLLVASWAALIDHPAALESLRHTPERIEDASSELLRFAGPARAVFRTAVRDVNVGSVAIAANERVTLMIGAANRDPDRFPNPDVLDLDRSTTSHLAFGAGPHACAGSGLIRLALNVATTALIGRATKMLLVSPISFGDGFAIAGPQALYVNLCATSA